MAEYRMIYNPFTVETKILCKDRQGRYVDMGSKSAISYIYNMRLLDYLTPRQGKKDFFHELSATSGDSAIHIDFVGTIEDFNDISAYAKEYYPSAEINYGVDRDTADSLSASAKLKKVNSLLADAKKNDIGDEVVKSFQRALDPNFTINVHAPVSCGKSTLQNAMFSRRLLPTANAATTAVITTTRINNSLSDFRAISVFPANPPKRVLETEPVTQKLIERLNAELQTPGMANSRAARDMICIEGPMANFDNLPLTLYFVDTPGPNNGYNETHREVMNRALTDKEKNMVIFLFSNSTVDYDDTKKALTDVANTIKEDLRGRVSSDRFLFVCTHVDGSKDLNEVCATQNSIRRKLEALGITNPHLFMVSAYPAELMAADDNKDSTEELTEFELEKLTGFINQLSNRAFDTYTLQPVSTQTIERTKKNMDSWHDTVDELAKKVRQWDEDEIDATKEEVREWKRTIKQLKRKIAYINTGIPMLIDAIKEYMNRYAIPMKIQQAYNDVMKMLVDAKKDEEARAAVATSQEALQNARQDLEQMQKDLKQDREIVKTRSQIEAMTVDENSIIVKQTEAWDEAKCRINVPKRYVNHASQVGERGYWVTYNEAAEYKELLINSAEVAGSRAAEVVASYINDTFIVECNDMLKTYKNHIAKLTNSHGHNLGINGVSIREVIMANPRVKALGFDGLQKTINEKVGERTEKKPGVIAWFGRLFGTGGTRQVPIMEKRNYYNIEPLQNKAIDEAEMAFYTIVQDTTAEMKSRSKEIKNLLLSRIKELDSLIEELVAEEKKKLNDVRVLNEEYEKAKRKYQVLFAFINDLKHLLDVENV